MAPEIKLTQKAFFKKYPYKVVLKTGSSTMYSSNEHFYSWGAEQKKIRILPETIAKWIKKELEGEFKTRKDVRITSWTDRKIERNFTFAVYFKDSSWIKDITKRFHKHILEIHQPINEKHLEQLENEKVRVRKNLYYGKYRYKFILDHDFFRKNVLDLNAWMEEMFGKKHENKIKLSSAFYVPPIFIKDEDTAVLFKLAYGHAIASSEKLVLLDEVS